MAREQELQRLAVRQHGLASRNQLLTLGFSRREVVRTLAERFDVARSNARRHLGFGHGVHRCVGARLAEVQLAAVIEAIVNSGARIVPQGAPTRLASPFLHGFTAMPVQMLR